MFDKKQYSVVDSLSLNGRNAVNQLIMLISRYNRPLKTVASGKRGKHLGKTSDKTRKIESLCYSRCGTILVLPCS